MAGCVMSDWRKKCKSFETLSSRKASGGSSEIIRAIVTPMEKSMPAKKVIMKIAQADELDDIISEANRSAALTWKLWKFMGGWL